jgi:hypothetical protein
MPPKKITKKKMYFPSRSRGVENHYPCYILHPTSYSLELDGKMNMNGDDIKAPSGPVGTE